MAESRESARKLIGTVLIALLIAIVVLGFATLFMIETQVRGVSGDVIAAVRNPQDAARLEAIVRLTAEQSKAQAGELSALLNIVFGPVVTLLGSVTGFYFGSKSRA